MNIFCYGDAGAIFFLACTRSLELKKLHAVMLIFVSFITVLLGAAVYVIENNFLDVKSDVVESDTEGIDDPNDLDFGKGSYFLVGLSVFMVIYRVIILSILK